MTRNFQVKVSCGLTFTRRGREQGGRKPFHRLGINHIPGRISAGIRHVAEDRDAIGPPFLDQIARRRFAVRARTIAFKLFHRTFRRYELHRVGGLGDAQGEPRITAVYRAVLLARHVRAIKQQRVFPGFEFPDPIDRYCAVRPRSGNPDLPLFGHYDVLRGRHISETHLDVFGPVLVWFQFRRVPFGRALSGGLFCLPPNNLFR